MPVDTETVKAAQEFGMDPMIPALNGGEDFELLFTVPIEEHQKIREISGATLIGHLTEAAQGRFMITGEGNEVELRAQGWETADE